MTDSTPSTDRTGTADSVDTLDTVDPAEVDTAPVEVLDDEATDLDGDADELDSDLSDEQDERDEQDEQDEQDDAPARGGRSSNAADRLEREGDVAADYLERLLDVADLDGDIEVDIDGDRAAVAVVDSDEGRVPRRLVGRDGEVLEALQELTRLAVLAQTGERSRLMLDVAGHRAARREALVTRAHEAVAQVRASGEQLALEAMTPFERKVVHDAVAAQGLGTESEGVEPHRHVVVLPS